MHFYALKQSQIVSGAHYGPFAAALRGMVRKSCRNAGGDPCGASEGARRDDACRGTLPSAGRRRDYRAGARNGRPTILLVRAEVGDQPVSPTYPSGRMIDEAPGQSFGQIADAAGSWPEAPEVVFV